MSNYKDQKKYSKLFKWKSIQRGEKKVFKEKRLLGVTFPRQRN